MADSDYFQTINESELRSRHRNWTGNDESGRYVHNGIIRTDESPLDIRLKWKSSPTAQVRLVGCYRLDLGALLRAGYVRREGPGTIRLQFAHHEDGSIYIRVRRDTPRLRVGYFEGD